MFTVIAWVIYVVIVRTLVKLFYPSANNSAIPGFISAIIGSFVGGFFNWVLGAGDSILATSGIAMGVVGTIAFLYVYDYVQKQGQK